MTGDREKEKSLRSAGRGKPNNNGRYRQSNLEAPKICHCSVELPPMSRSNLLGIDAAGNFIDTFERP
jgi:hypothetical protein